MWVPNNLIGFNQNNQPYFKNQENDNNNIEEPIEVIDISHEFKETSSVSTVENFDENSVQFEGTSANADESYDENSVQFERTSNVIKMKNSYSEDKMKTKEKTTWSINETRALIGAIEARYGDMNDVHKRKNFWLIISEELGSQNIEVSKITLYN